MFLPTTFEGRMQSDVKDVYSCCLRVSAGQLCELISAVLILLANNQVEERRYRNAFSGSFTVKIFNPEL